jgi:F-type H+-transporting ATPase subunit alpha
LNDNTEIYGIVNYLDKEGVAGITVLGDSMNITAQTMVSRLYLQPSINCDYNIIGKVVDPLGKILDGEIEEIKNNILLEQEAPSIIQRQPVREPLETGIKFIDSMIPIGCGQRELIIGDKKNRKNNYSYR